MSAPANKTVRLNEIGNGTDGVNSMMLAQQANIIASLRLLTAKLDADAGVTDTNYTALIVDSAIATAPVVIASV